MKIRCLPSKTSFLFLQVVMKLSPVISSYVVTKADQLDRQVTDTRALWPQDRDPNLSKSLGSESRRRLSRVPSQPRKNLSVKDTEGFFTARLRKREGLNTRFYQMG